MRNNLVDQMQKLIRGSGLSVNDVRKAVREFNEWVDNDLDNELAPKGPMLADGKPIAIPEGPIEEDFIEIDKKPPADKAERRAAAEAPKSPFKEVDEGTHC
jgi:hypothetical protein